MNETLRQWQCCDIHEACCTSKMGHLIGASIFILSNKQDRELGHAACPCTGMCPFTVLSTLVTQRITFG